MANNTITINFTPCEPTPAGGYRVRYRPMGGSGDFRVWPVNFTASPIVFTDTEDPIGTSYEGYIQGDCGDGQLGVDIPWIAFNGDATSESGGDESASASEAPIPCRTYTLTKTVGTPSAHYKDCSGVTHDTLINDHTVICTDGHGFTISGGGITVNSFVDGPCV